MEIALGGRNFDVAVDKTGSPLFTVGSRASQPGDGKLTYAEWRPDGHDFNGFEVIPPGGSQGYLGRAYGEGTDGRDLGLDHLGPLINTITLSTHDAGTGNGALDVAGGLDGSFGLGPVEVVGDSTGSSNGSAQITRLGTPYQYVIRGSRPAKIDLLTMGLVNAGLVLDTPATDIIATTPTSTTVRSEVSIGVGASNPYVSVTEPNVGLSPATDTWAANSSSQSAEQFGIAPDRTVAVTGNTVRGNIQTGSVTMTSPNWATLFSLPLGVTGTGFAVDGNLWVLGTNEGPMVVDGATGDPFPLIPELSRDSDHCRQMSTWFALGVIMPLRRALRYLRNQSGKSFGPETFPANTSPVTGQPTAVAASERELFTIEYNVTTGNAYLVAWYERQAGDQHNGPVSPYVLAKFTAKQSRFLTWLGTVNGQRTNDTLLGGYGSDAFWVTCGRTQRWIDDTNYLMAASGTTYGTETRRDLDTLKDVEFVEFDAAGTLDAGKTITMALSLDDTVNTFTATTTAGVTRLYAATSGVPTSAFQGVYRIAPRWTLASNSTTAGPRVRGPVRVYYRLRPTTVRQWNVSLKLAENSTDTPAGLEATLRAMVNAGSKLFESLDRDITPVYVKVLSVSDVKFALTEVAEDTADGLQRYVSIELEEWTSAAAA